MKTSVLKPGLLVALSTSLKGGITYQRVDIETDHVTAEGARVARWETKRHIDDPEAFDRATELRGRIRSMITSACCQSSFGLLCPTSEERALEEAIKTARALAIDHNATDAQTKVEVYVLIGRIAQDDAEAARAIAAEMRELLTDMQEGIREADPERIREAANKARGMEGMLSPEVAGQVSQAIMEARKAARELVRRVGKAGEEAAGVITELSTQRVKAARFAFLDVEERAQEIEREAPAGRGVDLNPQAPKSAAPALALPFLEV